jgi:hypothetical protein
VSKVSVAALGVGLVMLGAVPQPAAAAAVFGTLQRPQACPADRTVPRTGLPDAVQARRYFACTNEDVAVLAGQRQILLVVDQLEIRLADKARPVTVSDIHAYRAGLKGHIEISRELPVLDIKASFRETTCHSIASYEPGASCSAVFYPMSAGLCFRDTMGDWSCRLHPDSWRAKRPAEINAGR